MERLDTGFVEGPDWDGFPGVMAEPLFAIESRKVDDEPLIALP